MKAASDGGVNADVLTMLAGVQLTLVGIFLAVSSPVTSDIVPLGVVALGTAIAAYGWYPT